MKSKESKFDKIHDKILTITGIISIIAVLIVLVSIIISCIGCDFWHYERLSYDPNGVLINEVKAGGGTFAMDSSIDKVKVKIEEADGSERSLTIGGYIHSTDSNSVRAIGEGVVGGIGAAVTGR